jgi:hypothetical protein
MAEERRYDLVVFGDEVPGVLAAVAAAREQRRRGRPPRVLLLSPGPVGQGLGGHLVRGRLAYLDRSQIAAPVRQRLALPTFGDPPALYAEFLREAGVGTIALAPERASAALERLRRAAGVDLLSAAALVGTRLQGNRLEAIELGNGDRFAAGQFIDATVNAQLARAAGAAWRPGFASFGLPDAELAVTVVFETCGLSPARLGQIEAAYHRRFLNPADTEAQGWLLSAAGGDRARAARLRADMGEGSSQPRQFFLGSDYIDVRSPALSVAFHAFRGLPFSLEQAGVLLDKANIARLPDDRLIWNALLFAVDAAEADALALAGARPRAAMLAEAARVQEWFTSLGATAVPLAPELYIRHAGNISRAVSPISGSWMLAGGLAASEGLASFGYHFDIRGGIRGLDERAGGLGIRDTQFPMPLFNVGIGHALLIDVPNVGVVSPASGFEGYAASAGRIVEHNVGVGVGLGIAAVLAVESGRDLGGIRTAEVRQVLDESRITPRLYGAADSTNLARLERFEIALLDRGQDGTALA